MHRQRARICLLLAMFGMAALEAPAAAAATAVATLPDLEELLARPVVAAAKRPQQPAQAPSAVSIISGDEIRTFGWRTLGQALSSLRGVFATYDRSYLHLGTRGYGRPGDYNARILLLLNGVPTNDGIYDQAAVGSDFQLDMALIDRIEYVPGPASALYGGNAFFAVVNVVTLAGAASPSEVEAAGGNAGERGAALRVGRRDEQGSDWSGSLAGFARRGEDLYFPAYAGSGVDPTSRGMDGERSRNAYFRVDRGEFSFDLLAGQRVRRATGGPYGVDLNDRRNINDDRRLAAALRVERQLDPDWSLGGQLFAGAYSWYGDAVYGGAFESEVAHSRYFGGELSVSGRAAAAHTLTAGVTLRDDARRAQVNASPLDADSRRTNLALFAQDDWRISNRLTLSAGARADRDSLGRSAFSPRYAFIYNDDEGGTLKWMHGRAFRPPNAFETDYRYVGSNEANPGLQSERIESMELAAERRWTSGRRVSASLYRNRLRRLIVLQTDATSGVQRHENAGAAATYGAELEFASPLGPASVRVNGSWQRAVYDGGVPIANTPQALANLLVALPLPQRMSLGWESKYVGPRRVESGDIAAAGARIGGYTSSDLTLGGRVGTSFDWRLQLANLFDRRIEHVVGSEFDAAFPDTMTARMPTIEQEGRAWRASLRWAY